MAFCTSSNCDQEAAWRIIAVGYQGDDVTDQLLCRIHGTMPPMPETPGQYSVTVLGPFDEGNQS